MRPGNFYTFWIHDPKKREISAAPIRDRVVHHALIQVLEPIFERSYIYDSYACRKGKGQHKAVLRAQRFCRRFPYFLKLDIQKFFYSISHSTLLHFLRKKIDDFRVLKLVEHILKQQPLRCEKGRGLPIGNLTSQHFANFYLDKLDHQIKDQMGVQGYLRYMDDFCLFGKTKEELRGFLTAVQEYLAKQLDLKLNREQLDSVKRGLPFLGWRIYPYFIRLQRKGKKRFYQLLKKRQSEFLEDKISEDKLISSVASLLGHVCWGNTWQWRNRVLEKVGMEI